jgi:hypothetical protein
MTDAAPWGTASLLLPHMVDELLQEYHKDTHFDSFGRMSAHSPVH